jgi:hypothetical protein
VPPKAPLPAEPVRFAVVAATVSTDQSPFIAVSVVTPCDRDAVAVLQAVAGGDRGDDRRGVRAAGDQDAAGGGRAGAKASLLEGHVLFLCRERPGYPAGR